MSARVQTINSATLPSTPAPLSGWRRMVGDCLVVGGATAVGHVVGMATSLLLRLLLDPAQMGVWQGLKTILGYANYANLGISKGATREFTVARGRGDMTTARVGLSLAFTVNLLSSLAFAAALSIAGVWIGFSGGAWSKAWAVGLVAVGLMAVVSRYVTYHVTIFRSAQAFTIASQVSVLEGVLTLGVCGLTTWWFGLPGLYAGTLLVMVAMGVFVRRHRAVTLGWAWDAPEIRRLVAIGGPILLAGVVGSLFRSLDKVMILAYLPDREFQLGCYSVALLVSGQLMGIGDMLSIVMGPRYGEKYGQSGNRRVVAQLAARATELQSVAMALPTALAMVAAPPLLARLLPDYQTGLAAVQWLAPGIVILAAALPASQYLVAVDRQNRALAAVLVATAAAALGNHLALKAGLGLPGVAAATALSYGVYFVLILAVSLWPELNARARFRYVGMLALALGPTIGLASVLGAGAASGPLTAAALGIKMLLITLVWIFSAALGWHYGGWGEQLQKRST